MGTRFQAEIPLIRDRALAAADPHKADLVWQPWEDLESSQEKQRQGEEGPGSKQAEAGWWAGGPRPGLVRPSPEHDSSPPHLP